MACNPYPNHSCRIDLLRVTIKKLICILYALLIIWHTANDYFR